MAKLWQHCQQLMNVLKSGNLLHKRGFVDSQFGTTVKKLTGGDGSVSLGKRIVVAADVGLAAAVSDAVVVSRSSSSCLL